MGEPAESRFRRGEISAKAASKYGGHPGILRQTRAQASKMADFDDKGGLRDQGRGKDRGDVAGGRGAIDHRQGMGSPAHAGGAPSRGGGAGSQSQPTRRAHIDAPALQRPEFPAGAKVGKRKKGLRTPRKVAGGGGNPEGPQYGDPDGTRRYG